MKFKQITGGDNTGKIYTMENKSCDCCGKKDLTEFIDGNSRQGGWTNFCPSCHKIHGIGLGIGKGQKYIFVE